MQYKDVPFRLRGFLRIAVSLKPTAIYLIVALLLSTLSTAALQFGTATPVGAERPPFTSTLSGEVVVRVETKTENSRFWLGSEIRGHAILSEDAQVGDVYNAGYVRATQEFNFYFIGAGWNFYYATNEERATVSPLGQNQWRITFGDDSVGGASSLTMIVSVGSIPNLPDPPVNPDEGLGGCNDVQPNNCGQWHTDKPIDTSTGNFWHTFNDVGVAGRGVPLALDRTYNSRQAGTNSPFGYGWTFNYNTRLVVNATRATLHQENGAQAAFLWTGTNYVPEFRRTTAALVKNANGTFTLTRGKTEKLEFSSAGVLQSIRTLNGYPVTLTRPNASTLVATDASARALTFTYTGSRITGMTDPNGRSMAFAYNGAGDLIESTDFAGGKTKFTYDGSHRLLTMRSPKYADAVAHPNAVIANVYDAAGRVSSQTDELGRTTALAYSGDWGAPSTNVRVTLLTNPDGQKYRLTYMNGVLVERIDGFQHPSERSTRYEYDPASAGVVKTIDQAHNTVTRVIDTNGNVTSATDQLNRTTGATYNGLNQPLTVTDPAGRTTTYAYDVNGNLVSTSVVKTETNQVLTSALTYGDTSKPGDVTKITDPAGKAINFTYNSHGDVTSVTDPVGNKMSYSYNGPVSLGWVTGVTSPRGNFTGNTPAQYTTLTEFDLMGRPTSVKDPLWNSSVPTAHQTSAAYDANGQVTSATDGAGQTQTTHSTLRAS